MKKAYCVGMIACDLPLRPVPAEIFQQEYVCIDLPEYAVGGDAANVAITLRKLGMDVSFSGLVGQDTNGDFLVERLAEQGIDVSGIFRHPTLGTVVSYVLIEPNGERHFVIGNKLNSAFDPRNIPSAPLEESDLVFFGSAMALQSMDDGGTAALFKKAHERGKLTAVDFKGGVDHGGDYWLPKLEPMLRETDLLLPSYQEAVRLTGERELSGIRRRLSGYGIKVLAVKLGGEGCYVTDFKDEWKAGAFEEFTPLDTTGAGDSFDGGFIRAHLAGWSPHSSALFANAVAGYNITQIGATAGVPDFETVYRYVTEHCGGTENFPVSWGRKGMGTGE